MQYAFRYLWLWPDLIQDIFRKQLTTPISSVCINTCAVFRSYIKMDCLLIEAIRWNRLMPFCSVQIPSPLQIYGISCGIIFANQRRQQYLFHVADAREAQRISKIFLYIYISRLYVYIYIVYSCIIMNSARQIVRLTFHDIVDNRSTATLSIAHMMKSLLNNEQKNLVNFGIDLQRVAKFSWTLWNYRFLFNSAKILHRDHARWFSCCCLILGFHLFSSQKNEKQKKNINNTAKQWTQHIFIAVRKIDRRTNNFIHNL